MEGSGDVRSFARRVSGSGTLGASAERDPEVRRQLQRIKARVRQLDRSSAPRGAGAAAAAPQPAPAPAASKKAVMGASATGLLIGSARLTARDDTMETCYQEQCRTTKIHDGYVQTARRQMSVAPRKPLNPDAEVNNDTMNYIYKVGDYAGQNEPAQLKTYVHNLDSQLKAGEGSMLGGTYDKTNQCAPWKAATQDKAHWLRGRSDGSLSPFVPFEKMS